MYILESTIYVCFIACELWCACTCTVHLLSKSYLQSCMSKWTRMEIDEGDWLEEWYNDIVTEIYIIIL